MMFISLVFNLFLPNLHEWLTYITYNRNHFCTSHFTDQGPSNTNRGTKSEYTVPSLQISHFNHWKSVKIRWTRNVIIENKTKYTTDLQELPVTVDRIKLNVEAFVLVSACKDAKLFNSVLDGRLVVVAATVDVVVGSKAERSNKVLSKKRLFYTLSHVRTIYTQNKNLNLRTSTIGDSTVGPDQFQRELKTHLFV